MGGRRPDQQTLCRSGTALAAVRRFCAQHWLCAREAIAGNFLDGLTRENFRIAHDISAYSFPGQMAKAGPALIFRTCIIVTLELPRRCARGAQLQTMAWPGASLESAVRYLAEAIGQKAFALMESAGGRHQDPCGQSGVGTCKLLSIGRCITLRRNATIEEVGNVAAFLLNDRRPA